MKVLIIVINYLFLLGFVLVSCDSIENKEDYYHNVIKEEIEGNSNIEIKFIKKDLKFSIEFLSTIDTSCLPTEYLNNTEELLYEYEHVSNIQCKKNIKTVYLSKPIVCKDDSSYAYINTLSCLDLSFSSLLYKLRKVNKCWLIEDIKVISIS